METTETTNQSKSNVTQLPKHELDILEAIIQIAPEEIGKRFSHEKGACIASTAIGLVVLKHFDLQAEPICVTALAGNADFIKWQDAGSPPFKSDDEAKASGVRFVVIDEHNRLKRDGFCGHLVIGLRERNRVIDLGLSQFRRPNKNIDVPDAAMFIVRDSFWSGVEMEYREHGIVFCIQKMSSPPDWTRSGDWTRTHEHHEIAKKIIRKVERETK